MKILLDPQTYNEQEFGGISRYYTEIFSHLIQQNEVCIDIPVYATHNIYLKESILYSRKQKRRSFFISILSVIGISIRKFIGKKNIKQCIKMLCKKEFDLFIPTYYNSYFLEWIGNKPYVLTVYDMIHELYPKYCSDAEAISRNKLVLMEKAAKIIAVSENTKKDIIKIYPHIDSKKIEVIYHGSSIVINDSVNLKLPEKYILFVGMRSAYKNFIFLLNSVSDLLKEDSSLFVVCAGGGQFSKDENKLIDRLGLKNQVVYKYFKEDELGVFYKKAICFVFPSMYEGFGIPVLESMACGCPIVLTNNSSFPEVAGDAGVYFELNDSEDLKNKIKLLIDNKLLREEFSLKGLEQVKKFNWENAAKECFKLYKNTIG
jgi:glycosyltransferase involved in cell wall biosynthesis